MAKIVLGTRGSRLALAQTQWVTDRVREHRPDLDITVKVISTEGDRTQAANIPLESFGEKGIFARELETALIKGEIDAAVHSMKDLAHTLPDGLTIGATPVREDFRDCLIGSTLADLPHGARIGTGSVRRRALLLSRRPDLGFVEVRGNVDTRLRKLREGQCDVLCLAVAGLNRLGLSDQITEILDPEWFTPDPGQGAIAIEVRDDDSGAEPLIAPLRDIRAELETRAERAYLKAVGGSCKTPVGALGRLEAASADGTQPARLSIAAMRGSASGRTIARAKAEVELPNMDDFVGCAALAEGLWRQIADTLRVVHDE